MGDILDKDNPRIKLRAFRAIDEPETCELFAKGHTHVLNSIGVTQVTSSKNQWINNPAAFVLIVESLDKKKVYGGARVHVAGGSESLPIEEATGKLDPSVYNVVYDYAQKGTGEICGLWNSREIAGYGIGSIFLTRAAVAISTQINLQSLFALCAPYTIQMAAGVGYEIITNIGKNGTFYYPKLDLLATAMVLKNVETLSLATDEDKHVIKDLRKNPFNVRIEELRRKRIEVHYEIDIPNLNIWSIEDTIENFNQTFVKRDYTSAQN